MNSPFLRIVCWGMVAFQAACSLADETYEPSDPIAAVDGEPIYLGELNLILSQRFQSRDWESLPIPIQQATTALLIRRHLAMKSLRDQGGASIEAMIRKAHDSYAAEARRRGSSLAAQAKARKSNDKSLATDLAWQTAWGQYLKSTLTEKNLRLFFQKHASKYGDSRWEVSQIFVKIDVNDTETARATILQMSQLANEIRQANPVENAFADVAREHSQGGTAAQGGKVGWVAKDGDLPGRVMKVVRDTVAGEVAGPIHSPLGVHLIFVHQSETGQTSFDQLTDRSQLRRDATDALFDALVAKQKGAKVTWFIDALRPPPDVRLLP